MLDTRFLTGTGNTSFIGDAYAFATDEASETRFDPEGARVDRDGNVYVSDEYGPYIRKFNQQGQLLARIAVPPKFLLDPVTGHKSGDINNPADAASLELTPANNVTGRQANRGMEGLAITPGGTMLVGIMQNALIQDNGLADVTDVSSVPVLPEKGTDLAGLGITPVKKTLFLDLLKDVYKVNATQTIKDVIAEKIEALAWGPDLPDGRHVLYVVSDNHLNRDIPTQMYAFAAAAGVTYVPQDLPAPMFPPGQVKKALGLRP